MWRWLQRIVEFLSVLFPGRDGKDITSHVPREQLPEVFFDQLSIVDKTPGNTSIREKEFVEIVYENVARWVMFRCPCSCGTVISLPLQQHHHPRWTVSASAAGRPTLRPSVWQNKGCMSHFWIRDGRVFWCDDSGIAPSLARPDLYARKSR